MADHTDKALTDLTAQLADAIMSSYGLTIAAEQLAAALLPVVREYGDRRAAEELEAIAEAAPAPQYSISTLARARAAALRGEAGRET